MKKAPSAALAFIIAISVTAYAHPGRTDKNGGHNVRTPGWGYPVGTYHYHKNGDTSIAYNKDGSAIEKMSESTIPLPSKSPTATSAPEKSTAPKATKTPKETAAPKASATPEPFVKLSIDGKPIDLPAEIALINDSVMVPMRAVFEALGATVEYDEKTKAITATYGKSVLKMTIDSDKASYNNQEFTMYAAPTMKDGITYIPLVFTAEAFNCGLDFDEETYTLDIITIPPETLNIDKTKS